MSEPSEKYKDVDFLITRIGLPAVMCGFLGYLLWHDIGAVKKLITTCIWNERAIMQKLGIPLDIDRTVKKPTEE